MTLVALLALAATWLPPVTEVRHLIADGLIRVASLWPPEPAREIPDVVIVALDARSLREHRDWPWPRTRWAELIQRLDAAGARAIGFDIDFSTPRAAAADAAFGRATAGSGHVVLGAFRQFEIVAGLGEVESAAFPVEVIAKGAAAVGASNLPMDGDGTVRRGHRWLDLAGVATPSLPAALLAEAWDDAGLPTGEPFPIDYRRIGPAIPVLSASDVLADRIDPEQVRGKVVLVGATAMILQDLWTTPVRSALPGVLILATQYRHLAAEAAGQRVLAHAGALARLVLIVLISIASRLLGSGRARDRLLA